MATTGPTDIDAWLETVGTAEVGVDLTAAPDEGVTLGATAAPPTAGATAPEASLAPPPPSAVPLVPLDGAVDESDFEMRDLIGEGAMGRVHLAWQRSVGREVAVKIPVDGPRRGSRINALLREARVTGRLEHPNIVPMHGLGRTPDGATVMVMKRVEGVSWRAMADDPGLLPERFAGLDPLDCHLRILLEVCDAVHFAHSRGVLHRDLKLDNVLVGGFGEVYVVDWGIAVALGEDGTGHLPLARDVCRPAGTPGYMAPEMAGGEGPRLGPHSDVYCLGALLHRLLVGRTRHVGGSFGEVLAAAFVSAPYDYDPDAVPRELGRICNRATAADPDARYADVADLRRAIVDYLEHRDSARLVDEAAQAEAAMRAAIDDDADDAADRHFGVARFALEHALRIWPDNPDARGALDRLLLDRAERVLDAGQVDYAEQLVGAVRAAGREGTVSGAAARKTALAARVQAARDEMRRRARLARNADLSVFSRHRGAIAFGLGLLWTLNGFRRVATPPPTHQLITDQIWMMAIVFGVVFALRRWLWSTVVNRRVSLALMGIVTMDMAIRLAGWRLGLPSNQVAALEMVVDAGGVMYLALLVDRRLLAAVVPMAICAALGLDDPGQAYRISAWNVFIALSIIGGIWMWRAPEEGKLLGGSPADAGEAHKR